MIQLAVTAVTVWMVACGVPAESESPLPGMPHGPMMEEAEAEPPPAEPEPPSDPIEPTEDLPTPLFGELIDAGPLAPVYGGSIAIADGGWAVIAEPDLDQLYVVDVHVGNLELTVDLEAGDEPWRTVVDELGRVHVVLRGAGALATYELATGELSRRDVCPEPRGVGYQREGRLVHVACAGGDLVSFPAAGGEPVRRLHLDRDLRDVVVDGTDVYVSRLRTAEVLIVDDAGAVVRTGPGEYTFEGATFVPRVAWRMVAGPDGGAWVLHQRIRTAFDESMRRFAPPPPAYYGSDPTPRPVPLSECVESVTHTAVTHVLREAVGSSTPPLLGLPLPTDVSVSPVTRLITVVDASSPDPDDVRVVEVTERSLVAPTRTSGDEMPCPTLYRTPRLLEGRAIGVAHHAHKRLLHFRGRLMLTEIRWTPLPHARPDAGFRIFHARTTSGFSCATCHPEGGDDGHVWDVPDVGPRRTQVSWGRVAQTEPLHWDGSVPDLETIMEDGFVRRMGGQRPRSSELSTFIEWTDALRAPRPGPGDAAAIARGATAFAALGCADCHSGELYTDDLNHDVGTGGHFNTAPLSGLAHHPPYFHDGCSPTLLDAVTNGCGSPAHRVPASAAADLVAYLESL